MLHLHRCERADALTGPLADLLGEPPNDPFTSDVVAVPTRGVERWLAQRLSHRLGKGTDGEGGVCANIDFPSPAALVGDVLATVLGTGPDDDPWQVDRLAWQLLEVVDDCAGEPWCSALGRHLGVADDDSSHRRTRRLTVARHLASLFTSYGAQRPQLVRAWARGDDRDGAGGPVPPDLAWQPELWRRVRDAIGAPSPAERLDDALRLLHDDPAAVALPARLNVFGPTRMPEEHLQVLAALALHRDVHLWLLHPSPALWQRTPTSAGTARRADHPSPAHHPLLASMARDTSELQARLAALGVEATDTHHPGSGGRRG
ncbi:MAG TPA: exodeoxyribonuclease V subunit gamma, partial [Actinomycetales bacterium]|nr:exodeoxyribonuclease V subunit gamma [Actinomycetales bacterium]